MKEKILNFKYFILALIILLAAVLRLWGLGSVPVSPDWDEAALGYNAYSILHTGRDEYGKFLPVVLKSFGDYKPALYVYTIIPFLPFFDLSVVAVRLPSALLGTLSVYITYLLIKELFKRKDLALLSAFFLAISPWHIQFSRVAFEANLGLTCNILAVFFFIKGISKNYRLFTLSAFFAAFSIYSYQSEKVFVPLLFFSLGIIFQHEIIKIPKKYLIIPILLGFLLMLPMILTVASDRHVLSRAKQTSIFVKQTDLSMRYETRMKIDRKNGDILGILIDNKYVYFTKEIFKGYMSHFDLNWLFITGDINRHHAPGMGLLYLFELPLLLIGIYGFLFTKEFKRQSILVIFTWFLLAPVPASITTDIPHSVRTLNFLPTFQIFTALGALTVYFYLKEKNRFIRYGLGFVFTLFALLNFLYYLNQYFVQQNYFYAKDWQYGYKEIFSYVAKTQKNYNRIIVSDTVPMDQSYIFFLFYEKYDPSKYQRIVKRDENGYSIAFDKYIFKKIDWNSDSLDNNLLVGNDKDFPSEARVIYASKYLNGNSGMKVVKRK